MVLVIQVIGIVNLILALSNHHKLLLDIMSLIAGCMISFLGADGAVFSDPLSQVYPFLLVVLLVINLIGAKLIDSWQEEKKIQEEVKAREKNYKEEKKKHLEFSGKYPKGFYTALWKNFKSSKRDFIVYVSMNLLPATLIFSGVGMAQMLAPFNKEGNTDGAWNHGNSAGIPDRESDRIADADDHESVVIFQKTDEKLQYIFDSGNAEVYTL